MTTRPVPARSQAATSTTDAPAPYLPGRRATRSTGLLFGLWCALAAACGPITVAIPKPPAPTVTPAPPPAPLRTVQSTIRNTPNPSAQLLTDDAKRVDCAIVPLADGVPRAVCPLDPSTPEQWQGHLIVTAPDRLPKTVDFILQAFSTDGPNQDIGEVQLELAVVTLPRLVVVGQFFRLETNERTTIVGDTDFNLLGRFITGDDIEPQLTQRAAEGYNWLRVFTAYDVAGIGRLWPKEHPELYARIPAFANAAARHGLYVEYVGFTGPYPFFANGDEMVAHWEHLIAAIAPLTNRACELINEYDNPPNAGVPIERMRRPPFLCSHGSATQDNIPLQPFWDYATFHSSDPRKVVHDGWSKVADPNHIPVVVDETVRMPDNDASLIHAEDTGRGCAAFVAGCTAHSSQGKTSDVWSGKTLDLLRAWSRGAHSVPLEFQDGFYGHDASKEAGPAPCPCARYYFKQLPDGRVLPVPVRP